MKAELVGSLPSTLLKNSASLPRDTLNVKSAISTSDRRKFLGWINQHHLVCHTCSNRKLLSGRMTLSFINGYCLRATDRNTKLLGCRSAHLPTFLRETLRCSNPYKTHTKSNLPYGGEEQRGFFHPPP